MTKRLDLKGKIFGKLTVLHEDKNAVNYFCWNCKCECGNEKKVKVSHLQAGTVKSCGCLATNDVTNKIFGKLKALFKVPAPKHIVSQKFFWRCLCECGKETDVPLGNLTSGHTQSCGCSKKVVDPWIALKTSVTMVWQNYKDGNITFEDFYKISQLPCHYCGAIGTNKQNKRKYEFKCGNETNQFAIDNADFIFNGLDRVDNNLTHTLENVVPCCKTCNSAKLDRSYYDFLNYIITFENNIKINLLSNMTIDSTFEQLKEQYPKRNELNVHILNRLIQIKKDKIIARNKHLVKMNRSLIEFNLTNVQLVTLILSNCTYCGLIPNMDQKINMGIDRVNNNIGYIPNNVVSCCKYCNAAKNNLSLEEFLAWRIRAKNHISLKIQSDPKFTNLLKPTEQQCQI